MQTAKEAFENSEEKMNDHGLKAVVQRIVLQFSYKNSYDEFFVSLVKLEECGAFNSLRSVVLRNRVCMNRRDFC